MITVIGANGITGREVIKNLVQKNLDVRATASRRESFETLEALGATAVQADVRDPKAVRAALEGSERVLYIPPRGYPEEAEFGKNVINAAADIGVAQFVFHSVIAPQARGISFHYDKLLVEEALFYSGQRLPYTILRPTNYMQNMVWGWDIITSQHEFIYPYSPFVGITWVDLKDVAEATTKVLTQPGHEYATYEFCGRDAYLSRVEMSVIMSEVLGFEVRPGVMPIDDFLRLPYWASRPAAHHARVRTMFEQYDEFGTPAGNSKCLEMLLQRAPNSFKDFFERFSTERGVR